MSRWKQWVRPPEGALPGGIVTKAGVVLIAVLVGGLLFSWAMTGPQEADTLVALPEAQAVDDGMGRSLQARIRQEAERQTLEAAARARAELERRQAAAAGGDGSAPDRVGDAEHRSLDPRHRSGRVGASGGASAGGAGAENPLAPCPSRGSVVQGSERDRGVVRSRHRRCGRRGCGAPREHGPSGSRLIRAVGRGARGRVGSWEQLGSSGQLLASRLPGARVRAASSPRTPGTAEPGRSVRPADPPGWERIYEGSFLEAVLLTQLTGDFPGPVLAMVSVPFYSADRQRILIPRGARVVGTARAVQDPDQSRLAVAFHRLLLPDGSWIDLEFTGLNQAGEGALQDQVDRHYFSTFAAAGAIGVVSGLALAGGSPFGLRAGVGQGLGQSATSVLDRFLNRLPTITIRAGHRLRIWFTSDVLVPRAGTRQ